jgi:hypothetical protein
LGATGITTLILMYRLLVWLMCNVDGKAQGLLTLP